MPPQAGAAAQATRCQRVAAQEDSGGRCPYQFEREGKQLSVAPDQREAFRVLDGLDGQIHVKIRPVEMIFLGPKNV